MDGYLSTREALLKQLSDFQRVESGKIPALVYDQQMNLIIL